MRISLIVAAGGAGTRFERERQNGSKRHAAGRSPQRGPLRIPSTKVFYSLRGVPILCRSLAAFRTIPEIKEVVLAVPPGSESDVREFVRPMRLRKLKVVTGGRTRADSVKNALLKTSSGNLWVMVHDGARPLVTETMIRLLIDQKSGSDGRILAQKIAPTLKSVDEDGNIRSTVDRTCLYEAQTPQLVRRAKWIEAYNSARNASEATDEAGLLEAIRVPVKICEHTNWNPKITTFMDHQLAEAYLAHGQAAEIRTGMGKDIHRLVDGRKFILGGVRLRSKKGPLGHSDGDALLHAVTDAVLGVLGEGDIGDWYSDRSRRFKNISSAVMLQKVLKRSAALGWKLRHADTITFLESPRLGTMKLKIKKMLARLLGISESAVSVKAKTMEGFGAVGSGDAVACEALVTMERRLS